MFSTLIFQSLVSLTKTIASLVNVYGCHAGVRNLNLCGTFDVAASGCQCLSGVGNSCLEGHSHN